MFCFVYDYGLWSEDPSWIWIMRFFGIFGILAMFNFDDVSHLPISIARKPFAILEEKLDVTTKYRFSF